MSASRLAAEVKICGVTRPEDVTVAGECGVDAVGLNFYPPSPRALDVPTAAAIARAARAVGGSLTSVRATEKASS